MSILSPQFLIDNLELIGQIISVMLLVIFDFFFTEMIIFKSLDSLKKAILDKAKEKFRKRWRILIKYGFEFLATIIFIAYFFAGYWVLSEYIIIPILQRLQAIILLIILGFFILLSWMFNNRKTRKKYLGYN